jgi:transcription elongation factor Elf1
MDFIDVKYINLISSRLTKFKRVKSNLYNFRCPICGDSQKNKTKARGYFYQIKNNTNFKCHNCGLNISFNNFLKELDPVTHQQYVFEKFKKGHTGKNHVSETPEEVFLKVDSKPKFKKKIKIDLPDAFDVEKSKRYLHDRAIFSGEFYYAENFKDFVNSIKPNTFDSVKYGEQRIVIPLVRNEKLIGVQGRSLTHNSVKYLTIMLDEDEPKVYGLDRIDRSIPVYIVEGPFDSTFLPNSVAMCGSDGEIRDLEGSDKVYVYDNEPRNKEIVGRVERVIQGGGRVVIWPSHLREKDLNDMILAGHKVPELVKLNTYSGLEAKLKFTNWKKI